jgi:ABC-type sugar transport system permease subunit
MLTQITLFIMKPVTPFLKLRLLYQISVWRQGAPAPWLANPSRQNDLLFVVNVIELNLHDLIGISHHSHQPSECSFSRKRNMTIPQSSTRVQPISPQLVRGRQIRSLKNFITAMLFLAPSLIIFIVFVFIPLLKTIQLSMFLTDPIGRMAAFNFPDNYDRVFGRDDLSNSLKVSFLFALYVVPSTIILALFLAVLANVRLRAVSFFRVIFSSTIAVSAAAASLIFAFFFNPANGVLNYLLDLVGLPKVMWLVSESSALISISILTIWLQLGFCTIILLAALQGISQELYESATIDGAGFWQSFRHITVPLLSPTIFFLIIVQTLNSLQTFTQIDVLTKGAPVGSTNVLVYLIYRSFYFNSQYGIAATLSVVLFLLMLVLTVIQFGVLERRVFYS